MQRGADMLWWLICFAATTVTIFAKWYFTTAVERMRQNLMHEQRVTLELKGELSDLRQDQKAQARRSRDREADIKRTKSGIASLTGEIKGLQDDLRNKKV